MNFKSFFCLMKIWNFLFTVKKNASFINIFHFLTIKKETKFVKPKFAQFQSLQLETRGKRLRFKLFKWIKILSWTPSYYFIFNIIKFWWVKNFWFFCYWLSFPALFVRQMITTSMLLMISLFNKENRILPLQVKSLKMFQQLNQQEEENSSLISKLCCNTLIKWQQLVASFFIWYCTELVRAQTFKWCKLSMKEWEIMLITILLMLVLIKPMVKVRLLLSLHMKHFFMQLGDKI